jgi:hypothetical protein
VIISIVHDHEFKLRTATRNPVNEKANNLTREAVGLMEVVKVIMNDRYSCRNALHKLNKLNRIYTNIKRVLIANRYNSAECDVLLIMSYYLYK